MRRLLFVLALPLAACATDEDPTIDDGADGKADGAGRTIEVAVNECGPGALCPYVESAPCGLVTLHDKNDKQVAQAFTSGGGRVTFGNVAKGEYTVKVHERDGSLASMFVSDFSDETASAKIKVKVGAGETPWAHFNLPHGSADALMQCAELRGNITVTDAAGTPLDRHESEWNWFVELERDGRIVETSRLLFIYPDSNIVDFRLVPKGTSTLRYIRMDIPSYEQRPNPDYARLRRLYATDDAPLEVDVTIRAAQLASTIDVSRRIVDPAL